MNPSFPVEPIVYCVEIEGTERWSIYRRLQELEISCQCSANNSLRIEIHNELEIVQLGCVIKQSTASRIELIDWLESCWQIAVRPTNYQ